MRISTSYIAQRSIDAMLKQQTALAETQLQLTSGKRILNPSDDPVTAVKTLDLQRQINLSEQYLTNADTAESKLTVTDGILSSATDILQRIRELAIQGLNDTNDGIARKGIAEEIYQLNESLVGLANTRDSNGESLFSGFQSDVQAFNPTTYAYGGDSGQRSVRIADGFLVEINEPGDTVFSTATIAGPTQAIFQTIQDFADALDTNTVGTPPNNGDFLGNMDTGMDAVFAARTRIGARLNAVEQQRDINELTKFSQQTTLSQVVDLDYAEAISRLNLQLTGLQAAQQSFVRVQGLSLFNFL
ncbi:MAG: flagellar hook-associated protein FlgL [Gammaproteobacteria bacterium]|nr:flagellar hook-associated protein FlgL [Gammaproteobacteria bacterium]